MNGNRKGQVNQVSEKKNKQSYSKKHNINVTIKLYRSTKSICCLKVGSFKTEDVNDQG